MILIYYIYLSLKFGDYIFGDLLLHIFVFPILSAIRNKLLYDITLQEIILNNFIN